METVNFKGSYFNKCMIWLISIGVLISAVVFLTLNIVIEYKYFLSIFVVFIGIMIVFYLNRFEPDSIKISNEKIEISYFNKSFFKRKPGSYAISELKVSNKNDMLILSNNAETIGILRKDALDQENWGIIKNILLLKK